MSSLLFIYNVHVTSTSVRCPSCGKRLAPTTRVCPACGADQPLHIRRVRCNYCSRRVPAESVVCPHCKHNPRGFYIHPRVFLGLIGALALAALVYAALNPTVWINALSQPSTVTPTATATATATGVSALVITATLPPSATPTATKRPAATLTATVNPTVTPSPTPTRRIVKPLPLPTAIPSATSYPPPRLLAPSDGAKLSGPKRLIRLTFTSALTLQANQWFRVEVSFKNRTNNFANWCGWTKDPFIRFPTSYYDDSWQLDRTFRWHVALAQAGAVSPSTCAADSINVSPPSAEWTFYWY